jgi:hypothetical protein
LIWVGWIGKWTTAMGMMRWMAKIMNDPTELGTERVKGGDGEWRQCWMGMGTFMVSYCLFTSLPLLQSPLWNPQIVFYTQIHNLCFHRLIIR